MKKLNHFFILFFILIFSIPGLSQRKVGNGGGLAEMKLITLFQSYNIYLARCFESCNLNQSELKNLSRLKNTYNSFKATGGIDFKSDLIEKFIFQGERLFFNSKLLYSQEGVAKSMSEIGALLTDGLLSITPGVATSNLSLKLFNSLEEQVQTLTNGLKKLHLVKVIRSYNDYNYVILIEQNAETKDKTNEVFQKIGCRAMLSVKSADVVDFGFVVRINWTCKDSIGEGLLLISEDDDLTLIPDNKK
jgi:hypothetical protein